MPQKEYEMPEEYKQNLAHLADFLEAREEFRAEIKAAEARGVQVSAGDKALVDEKLREFDRKIDSLEKLLAEEYARYQAEKAREAELTKMADDVRKSTTHMYILIKHQAPHLLESFAEATFGPWTPEQREEFLDEVAVLESTKLDAILKGEN